MLFRKTRVRLPRDRDNTLIFILFSSDYLGPEIINSHIGLQAIHFLNGLVAQRLEHRIIIASNSGMFIPKTRVRLPASINKSRDRPSSSFKSTTCLVPAWILLSSTRSGTPTTICLTRWFSSNHPTYCVLFDGEPILGHAIGDVIYSVYNGKPDFLQKMLTREDAPHLITRPFTEISPTSMVWAATQSAQLQTIWTSYNRIRKWTVGSGELLSR
ncbi:hypothetical protein B0H13DRAFT_1865695 [Mycena leptocephala]|nr:hypothetical protein B0H13DRAFT_1865695 [Mycena leptocephala]